MKRCMQRRETWSPVQPKKFMARNALVAKVEVNAARFGKISNRRNGDIHDESKFSDREVFLLY